MRDDDDDSPDDLAWEEYRRQIDRRLDEIRPGRIGASDRAWRERVYGWARNHIPDETTIVKRFAEAEVDRREAQATKRANKVLRAWLHGQAPLSWEILGPLPIRVGNVRVRLDHATPEDVDDAARELARQGLATYQEVVLLVEGLRALAREARRGGHANVAQLGDQPPRGDEPGLAAD